MAVKRDIVGCMVTVEGREWILWRGLWESEDGRVRMWESENVGEKERVRKLDRENLPLFENKKIPEQLTLLNS